MLALLAGLGWLICRPNSPVQVLKSRDYTPGRDTLRDWAFLRETWKVDSAAVYNNLGVFYGNDLPALEGENTAKIIPDTGMVLIKGGIFKMGTNLDFRVTDNLFTRAIEYREKGRFDTLENNTSIDWGTAYRIARQNQIRNQFDGNALLDRHLGQKDSLPSALGQFKNTAQLAGGSFPVEKLDAQHGLGITYFYLNQRDSAQSIYTQLKTRGYFDTLSLRPNLQTLLLNTPASPPTAPVTAPPAPTCKPSSPRSSAAWSS